ncbi:hypothetical protein D3C76_1577360 [compost metagenome]
MVGARSTEFPPLRERSVTVLPCTLYWMPVPCSNWAIAALESRLPLTAVLRRPATSSGLYSTCRLVW